MKKFRSKKSNLKLIVFLIILLCTSLGYALYSQELQINGNISGSARFNVYFAEAWIKHSSFEEDHTDTPNGKDEAEIASGTVNINTSAGADKVQFNVTLNCPGDKVLIGTRIKNESSMRVKLNDFLVTKSVDIPDIVMNYIPLSTTTEKLDPDGECIYEFVVEWDADSTEPNPGPVTFTIELDYEQDPDLFSTISPTHYHDGNNCESIENISIPVKYQKVEYIESTATQCIDTGLSAKTNTKIRVEIRGSFTQSATSQYFFGAGYYQSEQNSAFVLMGQTTNPGIIIQDGWGTTEEKVSTFNTDKHTFVVDTISKCGIFDGNTVELPGNKEEIDINYNYYLFSLHQDGSFKGGARFKMDYCKITDENNNLIRYFVPCYCTTEVVDINRQQCSAGTIGMYEMVGGMFYTNSRTGTFRKGNDI